MVSVPLRAACASVAIALFLGGIAGLVTSPNALFLVPLFAAAILVMPAMFGGHKPSSNDLPRLDEQFHRFRRATMLCFLGATGVYCFVLWQRRFVAEDVLQHLASLGVALWLVAFVLMFFVAYYRSQRRLAME